jgi:signal recognition particle receptor subunit beta
MQEVLSKNVDGAIIIIDSINRITEIDLKIMNFIKEKGVPYVIFANKQDINNKDLNTDSINVPIIPTTAINGGGIDEGLKLLLKLID